MQISEMQAKSILVKSNLPEADYVINCYVGCSFACSYCYASFMGRLVGKKISDWGQYVYAKTNAPDLLEKDIRKLKDEGKDISIFFSSVTDAFQPAEERYSLTKKCLEVIADYGFRGKVSILTKSPTVLKAIPVLKKLENVEVGMTITSTEDQVSRYFEKFAPNVTARIDALATLNAEGIETYAFIGPLLPHFVADKEKLRKLLGAIRNAGTTKLFMEHINLSPYIRDRMLSELKDVNPEFLDRFYCSQSKDYMHELDMIIENLLKEHQFHSMKCRVFHHND